MIDILFRIGMTLTCVAAFVFFIGVMLILWR